jgi:hypothetical protein
MTFKIEKRIVRRELLTERVMEEKTLIVEGPTKKDVVEAFNKEWNEVDKK